MIDSWMIIGGVTLLVALGSFLLRPRDIQWAIHLRLPKWLFFEPAIPLIWTVVFSSGAWSATHVWNKDPGSFKTWLLMGLYLLLEIITVAYIPATLKLRSLKVGTIIGGVGLILCIVLAVTILPISKEAALLLLPYLIWSPIGTLTTWRMLQLNSASAV
ncbi:MAG: tryptophan-rich sensory protein [Chroococcidiopsidaceae cyanobacterium CP_BM_ER_R8_30]|nr:tryptophan-rich sensory protein [Chroococcidiopsidaceae cyanobacterium CP_BM_ER_R8_30]